MALGARRITILVGLLLLAAVPPVAGALNQPFYLDLFTRIMIFAIAAVSLDLILGYGGMVSFGHAAYLGIGAYAVGILSYYGITNGFVQFATALAAGALVALLIGLVSLRTSGVYFIMITLAFSQMIYFLGVSLNTYGGDDGMSLSQHSDFAGLVDLDNSSVLYYFVFAVLLVALGLGYRLVESRFGMVIRGAKSNERRMGAIGFPVFRYKLTAFVISGAMCAVAGALLANQALYVSPAIMHWTRSGEIMIMVILGGMGSLFGPVLGAVAFLVLEDVLAGFTEHWQVVLGPILILVVLFARRGIFGLLAESRRARAAGAGHG
jgi:branched-chain amino acid transport system permease protein